MFVITAEQIEKVREYIENTVTGKVANLWCVTEMDMDGQVVLVGDTSLEKGSIERVFFVGRLAMMLNNAVFFDYKEDVLNNQMPHVARIFSSGKIANIYSEYGNLKAVDIIIE